MLDLQRSVGNQAVARLISAGDSSSAMTLGPGMRALMEARLGHDFSRVRLHSGPKAAQATRDVNATAFTMGHNVVFGANAPSLQSREGSRLLAHELAHVIQQRGQSEAPSTLEVSQAGDQAELEATEAATAAMTGGRMPRLSSQPARIYRQPEKSEAVRETTPEPSALWYEVSDAHQKLITEIGLINQRVVSPTRSEWMSRISDAWAQIGSGNITNEQLVKFRDELNKLKAEINEEVTQARESWKVDTSSYQDERKALEAEGKEWSQDAINILDDQYKNTTRAVQVANAYLTFDDLIALAYMLENKKHRAAAQERWVRANEGPGTGSTMTTGAGLGAIITYQGKTLVQLGGEKFYVSGVPPKGGWTPKGGTTSKFFVYKKSNIKKMYRLDWDKIKMGPKQGQMGWEHNQTGVSKILGLKVTDHQPAGGWGRVAGTAIRIYKWGGRALFVAGLVSSALEIYYAENKARAIAKTGGALAGGYAGAKTGAWIGARVGRFGGWIGAGIGTFAGGLIGGAIGAWGGSKAAGYVYDLIVEQAEEEDDWAVLTEDQVEQI